MNQSVISFDRAETLTAASAGGASRLSRADAALLLTFYTGLDDSERRARFGGTASATTLATHCASLDWANVAVLAWPGTDGVVAVAEVHLATGAHAAIELAVACRDRSLTPSVWQEAIRFAASTAAAGQGRALHVVADAPRAFLPALLRDVGTAQVVDGVWVCTLREPLAR